MRHAQLNERESVEINATVFSADLPLHFCNRLSPTDHRPGTTYGFSVPAPYARRYAFL